MLPLKVHWGVKCLGASGANLNETEIVNEAKRMVEGARKKNITMRVMGATAVRIHCSKFEPLHESLGRKISDLDFMTLSKDKDKIFKLFREFGYYVDEGMFYAASFVGMGHRAIIKKNNLVLDVFFDKLEMCHTIDFSKRLEIDYPTISLADLLLEKMQIVKLNEKDILDTIVMFREHDVGERDKETINVGYVSGLLSRDWGFYYTVTTNLGKIKSALSGYDVLRSEDAEDIESKIDKLLKAIEDKPKSLNWRIRSKVGPSKKWYRDVDELLR